MKEPNDQQRQWMVHIRKLIDGSVGKADAVKRSYELCTPENVVLLREKYQFLADHGGVLFPLAASNMRYWLSKKGGTRTILPQHFRKDKYVHDNLLTVHRPTFLSETNKNKGIVPRLKEDKKAGKLKVGNIYAIPYKKAMEAQSLGYYLTELFWSLGGFTLESYVKLRVESIDGSKVKVRFTEWQSGAEDIYDWDENKAVFIPLPGYGVVEDAEAICLEKGGGAKSFSMKAPRWNVRDKDITADATVDLGEDFGETNPVSGATFFGYVFTLKEPARDIVGATVTLYKDGTEFKTFTTKEKPDPKVTDLLAGHSGCFIFENIPPTKISNTYRLTATYRNLKGDNGFLSGYVESGADPYPFQIEVK